MNILERFEYSRKDWIAFLRTALYVMLLLRSLTLGIFLYIFLFLSNSCAFRTTSTSNNPIISDKIFVEAQGANSGFLVTFSRDLFLNKDFKRELTLLIINRGPTSVTIFSHSGRLGGGGPKVRLNLKTGESGILFTASALELVESWKEIYVRGDLKRPLNVELLFKGIDKPNAPAGLMYNIVQVSPSF